MTKSNDIISLQATMFQYMTCVLMFTDKKCVLPKNKFADHNCNCIPATVYTDTNVHKSTSTKFSLKKVMNTTGQCNACHTSHNNGVASLVQVILFSCHLDNY